MGDQFPHDSDGDALRRLVATGSDLSREMQIDFAVDVPDRDTGLAYATAVARLGFRTDVRQGSTSRRWTCYCTRTMVASYDGVVSVQRTLEDIGRPYNAKPDGWGSFGNADIRKGDSGKSKRGRS